MDLYYSLIALVTIHSVVGNECSDEQKSVKKNLVKFGTRYIRFMLRARQPLKLLSDACTESRNVACVFYSCKK